MSTPPPPPSDYGVQQPVHAVAPKKKISVAKGCALGCGVLIIILVLIGIISAITGINSGGSGSTQTNIENMGNPTNLLKSGRDVVTLDEYTQIQNGMTYEQVVAIIGDPGVEQASSEMPGIQGVTPGISTKIYMWMNSGVGGGNMNAIFQNNALMQKAQFGLR